MTARLPVLLVLWVLFERETPRARMRWEIEVPWDVRVEAEVGASVAC